MNFKSKAFYAEPCKSRVAFRSGRGRAISHNLAFDFSCISVIFFINTLVGKHQYSFAILVLLMFVRERPTKKVNFLGPLSIFPYLNALQAYASIKPTNPLIVKSLIPNVCNGVKPRCENVSVCVPVRK